MTTTRELCRVLGAALQVRGIERHAARLVRDGWLPRAGEEVYERDAAILLLAVAAAPCPDQVSRVVEKLASLKLESLVQAGAVLSCDDTVRVRLPGNPLNALAEALEEYETFNGRGYRSFAFSVMQGGWFAVIGTSAWLAEGEQDRRLQYGEGKILSLGLETHAVVPTAALTAVAHALHSQSEVVADQQSSALSLTTH